MKILFYAYSALWYEWHTCILFDEAIKACNEGHEVYFAYNDCSLRVCTGNLENKKSLCALCHRRMTVALNTLPKAVKRINIKDFWSEKNHLYNYSSAKNIKSIEYKNVKIGCSVMASYITRTRNLSPKIDNTSRPFFDKLINATCNLTDAIENMVDTIHPDRMCFFNSRFFEWRPPFDIAVSKGIEAIVYEKTLAVNGTCKVRFINVTPHNIPNKQLMCDENWLKAPLSEEEKIKIGKDFFERRRHSLPAGDKVYTGQQEEGLLPSGWDSSKRNFVIFNSSEDEFASLGDEYDKFALFRSQFQGIKFILDVLKDDSSIHVYLRVHPNLANVPYRYHTELMNFSKQYENVTVIPALDSISTYALMDGAEKVIVFGSSMGLESAYWQKAVILLAGACYYYSDLCYIPNTESELNEMLFAKLSPKNRDNAVKWGFDFMYRNEEEKGIYIDLDTKRFKIGKYSWIEIPSLKLFGSSKLFAIYSHFMDKIYSRFDKPSPIPVEEDLNAEL